MQQKKIFLSVVIPVFNEEQVIGTTLSQVDDYLNSRNLSHEIVVINNGSVDRTRQVVIDWSKLSHSVKMLENVQNRGRGYAVRQGVLSSRGDWILFMDADGAIPIQEMEKCLPLMNGQWDVLIASRQVLGTSRTIFTRLANILVCSGVHDFTCGFKCFQRTAALELFKKQTMEDSAFDIEIVVMAKKMGYRMEQFPVIGTGSRKTSLKMFRDTWVCLTGMVRIWWNLIHGQYNKPR